MRCSEIAVIGGGIVGCTTALKLAKEGHNITIVDPSFGKKSSLSSNLNGTQASLGVLMGNIYKKSKGRSFELRRRSMLLWPKIIQEICTEKDDLKIECPLIRLASSKKEKAY